MTDSVSADPEGNGSTWFVRLGGPGEPGTEGETLPDVRLTSSISGGPSSVAIDIWAPETEYRLSSAEAHGRAAVVIRHPLCPCGRSGSEAERFLGVFERQSDRVFDGLRGEVVVILWDGNEQRLQAARAPGSTRPLFFAQAGGRLMLSDSIGTLHQRGDIEPIINRELLVCHLANSWHSSDETYFLGVRRVPPAHALRWRDNNSSFWQIWDPLPIGRPIDWAVDGVLERYDALFEQAVARSTGAGRAGVFLSGGLDSVSVAAVAADLAGSNEAATPLALSLAMPHPECDERETQAGVAADLHLGQIFLGFDEALAGRDFVDCALELSAGWPAPLQNYWLPVYLRLAEVGREAGCRVILTGHGGDEWLGVSPYLAADYLRRIQLKQWYRLWRTFDRSYRLSRLHLLRNHIWTFGFRPLVARGIWRTTGSVWPNARPTWRRWRRTRRLPGWIAPDPELRSALMEREEAALEAEGSGPSEDEYVRQCRLPISHMLVAIEQDELAEQGRRTGTLLRQPYFDPDLVAFLSRVRPEQLASGGRSKGLVRDEVARRCPGLGFERQRKVLGTALFRQRMLRGAAAAWNKLGGGPRALAEMGVVRPDAIQSYLESIAGGGGSARELYELWSLLSVESWVRARGAA